LNKVGWGHLDQRLRIGINVVVVLLAFGLSAVSVLTGCAA
jgi:hypothetical protein